LAEIQTLDCGSWFNNRGASKKIATGDETREDQQAYIGEQAPTLREALIFTRDNNWLRLPSHQTWLSMAVQQRHPEKVIHRSDQGSQDTALSFGKRCREAGVRPSMGSIGDCYDNALCESFFASLECELLDRTTFRTKHDARMDVFSFIENWYNPHRLHSSIGYLSPIQYEMKFSQFSQHKPLSVY